nr:immunoglobulin heavy chain junction region [Mus musculus]
CARSGYYGFYYFDYW